MNSATVLVGMSLTVKPVTSYATLVIELYVAVTLTDCYRRADMNLVDAAGAMVLEDHENVSNATPPFPSYFEDATQAAYHGKAAAADATVSSIAKELGWDEAIWDLSGAFPVLK